MKKSCILCLILALALLSGCAEEEISTERTEGVFGTFSTTTLSGEAVSEEVLEGCRLTMVNIWATFCGPCIQEMPHLGELDEEFGEDFRVVGIVVDTADRNGNPLSEKRDEALAIVEETGADYLHLMPSKTLNRAYLDGVQSVPETVFLDENGNQLGKSYLGARSKEEWKRIIETLLEETK